MAIPQEKFTSIKSEVIDVVSILFESFNPDLDVEQQLDAHHEALGQYINRVARIGMASRVVGYKGLRDVCVLFQDRLRILHQQHRILTAEERDLLEEWPMLVMAYLSDAGSAESALDLVNHLHRFIPAGTVSSAEYDELIENLTMEGEYVDAAGTNMLLDSASAPDIVPLAEEKPHSPAETPQIPDVQVTEDIEVEEVDVDLADLPDIQEEFTIELSSDRHTLEAIGHEIKEAVDELIATLTTIEQESQSADEISAALNLCADRMEILSMSIASSGLMGLMDIALMFQEGLRQLADNPHDPAIAELDMFALWASHVEEYLDNPDNPDYSVALVALLQQMPWLGEISEEEADTLLALLIPEEIDLDSYIYNDEITGDTSVAQADYAPVEEEITLADDSLHVGSSERVAESEIEYLQQSFAKTESIEADYAEPEPVELPAIDKPAVKITDSVKELISLISLEIDAAQSRLNDLLGKAIEASDDKQVAQAINEYIEEVDRFSLAADSVGLKGLSAVLGVLSNNLLQLVADHSFSAERGLLLAEWPTHVAAYLANVNDHDAVNTLVYYIANPEWPVPVNQSIAEEIQQQLLSPELESDDDLAEPRQQTATPEDVSLALPDDVNQDLLESLLRELPGHTSEFTESITRFTEGAGTLKDVDVAQRVAHTLKGAANTVGITGIASLTHHLEDILLAFKKHDRLPGAALSDSLMKAADTLEAMSESLLGMGPSPTDAVQTLQEILDWANRIDNEGIPQDDEFVPGSVSEPAANYASEASETEAATAEKDEQLSGESILRVPAGLVDELLRLVGETVILNGQLHERLRQALAHNRASGQHSKLIQQLTFELEQLVDIQGLTWTQQRIQLTEEFDALEMDQYNELHTVTRRLVEAASDAQEFSHNIEEQLTALDSLVVEQGRLHKMNQETVMQTRMVPVQNIVARLQRGARQAARLTDKKVKLEVIGADTMMDSDVLNNLIDPLMHILRNAIDHGIELEPRRIAAGKDTTGKVTMTFIREGDQMLVRCEDDGAGLDYRAIHKTAIERGLVKADEDVTEEELRRFILQQGFSTRTQATQISGRGIGMDAVYNRILNLKGSLNIDSEAGTGTRVELRLPITFISVHGLLVRMRNRLIAVSTRGIEQILYGGAGILHEDAEMLTYQLGEEVYDAVHLDTLLRLKADRRKQLRHTNPVLLVRETTGALRAVVVDEVTTSQDLVVKSLGQYLPDIDGIEGATILGDGSVAAVLDLPDLLRAQHRRDLIDSGMLDEDVVLETQLPCALVVDDSLTARRTLAEFIQDMGFEVRTARDGLEAIDVINARHPDILLVDLEMPRMNGLELTSHVRASQETRDIPIIMITSRSTEKHRQQAEAVGVNIYLTKPFSEEELMHHIEQVQSLA